MASRKRMMEMAAPTSTMRPAKRPLLAEWQSACSTTLLTKPLCGDMGGGRHSDAVEPLQAEKAQLVVFLFLHEASDAAPPTYLLVALLALAALAALAALRALAWLPLRPWPAAALAPSSSAATATLLQLPMFCQMTNSTPTVPEQHTHRHYDRAHTGKSHVYLQSKMRSLPTSMLYSMVKGYR